MLETEATLSLKEAAKRLGVHPNTLRNWEQRGLIRLVRLPGSRYRRVPASEVQRLLREMHRPIVETGGVRLDPPPDDPALITEGRALAQTIQAELAALEQTQTLEETMGMLRGRSWSS